MLEETLEIKPGEQKEFELIPEGIYTVELLDVSSEENETYNSKMCKTDEKEMETVLEFKFGLLDGSVNGGSLRGRQVWAKFVPSYLWISKKNGKNKLYKIVEALLGRELNQEEQAGFDGGFVNQLVGKHCQTVLEHKNKNDKTYTVLANFVKATGPAPALDAEEKEIKVEDIPF